MAVTALGVPATLPFDVPAEGSASFRFSSLSTPPSSSFFTGRSVPFCTERRKGYFGPSTRYSRYAFLAMCSSLEAKVEVAVSSSPSSEAHSSSSYLSAEEEIESKSPTIDLEFFGPEQGQYEIPKDKVSVASGEKLLRTVMKEQKLEVYDFYGKIMNCGGGGSCGTCIVEVLEGSEFLNERTDAEDRFLKKKPNTWRLSCQTIVGDKTNSGKVVVRRLPQKKK